jgi:hypothetical protein
MSPNAVKSGVDRRSMCRLKTTLSGVEISRIDRTTGPPSGGLWRYGVIARSSWFSESGCIDSMHVPKLA